MAADTNIEYLTKSWNPIQTIIKGESGQGYHCTHVDEGCRNCWAEGMNNRVGNRLPFDTKVFEYEIKNSELAKPLSWRKPQMIGVQFMGDLFHKDIPFELIFKVFMVMQRAENHTFLILTKRPERMYEFFSFPMNHIDPKWVNLTLNNTKVGEMFSNCKNIWYGTSISDQQSADTRIPKLLKLKGRFPMVKIWLSIEPMIKAIELQPVWFGNYKSCDGILPRQIDWVVCGGESGPHARPLHPDWVRSLRNQCKEANVSFFFKQWGEWVPEPDIHKGRTLWFDGSMDTGIASENGIGRNVRRVGKKKAGRLLDGVEHNEFPEGVGNVTK
ncbi:MAG: phage Gp37/Gp68 family protein [Ignavibacteriaceae bacterium]|jgi:protein gp37|nr:phage Gp37/Gp68 family protein [Ignavibacteriaceae bacterium]